ncbi:hypothetical protein [Nesterenkonia sp. K-15-9-6]|uniref:hypothetical protein n=1 Tax=Nesterenkonia sp. K-15-9-6 TaxID=3093918 RepID=UPI004044A45B
MSEHVPSTDQVRDAFAMRRWDTFQLNYPNSHDLAERDQEREAFDRWLAAVIRDAQAEAWDEAVEDALDPPRNPYRERTDDA